MDQMYVAAATLVISLLCFIKSLFSTKNTPPLPPGPRGLPILGYLPFLGHNLLHQFTDLAHKYGPIFKLNLGNKLCVVITSPSLVKEVVRDKDTIFANRDVPIAAFVASYQGNDIGWSKLNPEWRAMRKLFAQEMMSSRSLQASYVLRKDEVRKAIRQVINAAKTGKAVEIGDLSFRTQLNVLMNMLWGGTMEGEEGDRITAGFCVLLSELTDLSGKPNVSDYYPLLAGLDLQGVKKQTEKQMRSIDGILDSVIDERNNNLSRDQMEKQGKKDFLQILLEHQKAQAITQRQLKAILLDTVAGGSDTTATTVEWAMAELMNNPEVMSKAQKELSDVVGLNNVVEELHMPELKYLEAVVKETLRLHPPIPLLLPRSPSESSSAGGYTVPMNSRVVINVWAIQRDPSIWENPDEFMPERFVDEKVMKSDFRGNNFQYLPFGSGRRTCPGIPLAERMMIYLLASLLHSFDWKLAQPERLDMSETFGIVLRKTTPLMLIPNPRLSDSDLYDL